jgi:IS5 family transposase
LRPRSSSRFHAPRRSARKSSQRGYKLYSFHAPEVECIGKGKASAPYEFGVKASIVTTNNIRSRSRVFDYIAHETRRQ